MKDFITPKERMDIIRGLDKGSVTLNNLPEITEHYLKCLMTEENDFEYTYICARQCHEYNI